MLLPPNPEYVEKIQELGLQSEYMNNDDTKHFCGMIDGLAFLPIESVKEGMTVLKGTVLDHLSNLLDYFDNTYVPGPYRSVMMKSGVLRFHRTPPRFVPQIWNVHGATLHGQHRTNICESWNNGFRVLVGHPNPSLLTILSCLQKHCSLMENEHSRYQFGQPAGTHVKTQTVTHEQKLKTLCQQFIN